MKGALVSEEDGKEIPEPKELFHEKYKYNII